MSDKKTKQVEHYPSKKHRSPRTIFDQGYVTVMGEETDEAAIRSLRVCAYDAGYTFFLRGSRWVAVRRDLILPGTYTEGSTSDVTWAQCEIEDFELIAFLSLAPEYAEEYGLDDLLDKLGLEAQLVFYGGTKFVQKYERVASTDED